MKKLVLALLLVTAAPLAGPAHAAGEAAPPQGKKEKKEQLFESKAQASRAGAADPYIKVARPRANSLTAPEPGAPGSR